MNIQRRSVALTLIVIAMLFAVAAFTARAGVDEGGFPYDVVVSYIIEKDDKRQEDRARAEDAFQKAQQLLANELGGLTFNHDAQRGFQTFTLDADFGFFENAPYNDLKNWMDQWVFDQWNDIFGKVFEGAEKRNRIFVVLVEGVKRIGPANGEHGASGVALMWNSVSNGQRTIPAHGAYAVIAMRPEQRADDLNSIARTIAHELGHAFGLLHEFQEDRNLMGWRGGTLLTREQVDWITGTRYFALDRTELVAEIQISLAHVEKVGNHLVSFEYRVNQPHNAAMLQLSNGEGEMLALLPITDNKINVNILHAELVGVHEMRWRALSTSGTITSGRHAVELPGGVHEEKKLATAWAAVKIEK